MPSGRPRPGRRCVGHRRDGKPCSNFAVAGSTVCHSHGAAAPAVKAAAARRVAEESVLAAFRRHADGAADPVDPVEELLELAAEEKQFVSFTGKRVELLDTGWDATDSVAAAELALYNEAKARYARLLADLKRLGLAERAVQITEEQQAFLVMRMEALCRWLGADPSDPRIRDGLLHIWRTGYEPPRQLGTG